MHFHCQEMSGSSVELAIPKFLNVLSQPELLQVFLNCQNHHYLRWVMFPFQNSVINYQLHFQPHKSSSVSTFAWKSYYLPTPPKKKSYSNPSFFQGARDFLPVVGEAGSTKEAAIFKKWMYRNPKVGVLLRDPGTTFLGAVFVRKFFVGWVAL